MTGFALEPIEKASVDELRSLQLKRLQATLQHVVAIDQQMFESATDVQTYQARDGHGANEMNPAEEFRSSRG